MKRINEEEAGNPNRSGSSEETEPVTETPQQGEATDPKPSLASLQTSGEGPTSVLELSQNTEEGNLPALFCEASVPLPPKPDKDTARKEDPSSVFLVSPGAEILASRLGSRLERSPATTKCNRRLEGRLSTWGLIAYKRRVSGTGRGEDTGPESMQKKSM